MDLSNLLPGLTSSQGVDPARLATAVQEVFASKGGVHGLITSLRQGGLGGVVDSWISTGSNEPVEPAKLGQVLGPSTLDELSAKTGISIETLLPLLATFLPTIIDFLTPGGKLPEEGGAGSLDQIGDLLGGILGR